MVFASSLVMANGITISGLNVPFNLLEIEIASKKAITASKNVFNNDAYNNVCLYVPKGRKFAYEKTAPWKNFYIVEKDFADNNEVLDEVKSESGKVFISSTVKKCW